MFAVSLHDLIFLMVLVLVGVALLAVSLDRWRFRDVLLKRSGAEAAPLAQALESAPFGLALLDGGNHFVYNNRYAQRLLNTPSWQAALEQDIATVRTRGVYETVYRQLNLTAGQTLSWWICPLPRFSLVLLTDLTEQRRLQKTSQAFLGTLAHELRTPLTAVLAHLDIARKSHLDEPTRQESLTIAHQEMHRLAHLVQEMVQLGRLEMSEEIEKRPLDLLMVAETAVAQLLLNAEAKGITISLEAAAPLPLIDGDADKLKQVFLNVLDNSVKYGRAGDHISICLAPEAGGVRVTIQDTGPGIPPEHLPHVTERLYRANQDGQGSGLGLAIANNILRLHQARLEIDSPGPNGKTGVMVSFLLPKTGTG
jgi:two-component system phosphate regulon sensor histidine kinase PhoR